MATEDNIEEINESYQKALDTIFQSYAVVGTKEEKMAQLDAKGVDVSTLIQLILEEEKQKEDLLKPLGLPKNKMIDGKLENTYNWLIANTGFIPYVAGDSMDIIDQLPTVKSLKTLQQELQDAGYLKQGTYSKGIGGMTTLEAVDRLLRDSNAAGETWESMIVDVLTNPQYDISDLPTEPELDYNELGNTVVASAQREIGRDLTSNEYDILLGVLSGFKQEEFDDTIKQLTTPGYTTKKGLSVDERGFETPMVVEGQVSKLPVTSNKIRNAESRFSEYIQQKFKPEMDLNQRREQTKNVANIIKSSVAGLRSIGG